MHPRRDAVGRWPDLLVTNDGAVECRLLGPAAVVDPGSDAARWRLVLYAATDLGSFSPGKTTSKAGGVSKVGMVSERSTDLR